MWKFIVSKGKKAQWATLLKRSKHLQLVHFTDSLNSKHSSSWLKIYPVGFTLKQWKTYITPKKNTYWAFFSWMQNILLLVMEEGSKHIWSQEHFLEKYINKSIGEYRERSHQVLQSSGKQSYYFSDGHEELGKQLSGIKWLKVLVLKGQYIWEETQCKWGCRNKSLASF